MNTKTKLTALVATLAVGMIAQVAVILSITSRNDALTESLVRAHKNTAEIGAIAVGLQQMRRYEKEFIIYMTDRTKRQVYAGDVGKSVATTTETLTRMALNREGRFEAAEVQKFQGWQADLDFYAAEFRKLVDGVEGGAVTDAIAANAGIAAGKDRLRGFIDGAARDGAAREASVQETSRSLAGNRGVVRTAVIVSFAFALLLGLVILLMLQSSVVGPLERLASAADRVSRGELGVPIPAAETPELLSLSTALERMRTRLAGTR